MKLSITHSTTQCMHVSCLPVRDKDFDKSRALESEDFSSNRLISKIFLFAANTGNVLERSFQRLIRKTWSDNPYTGLHWNRYAKHWSHPAYQTVQCIPCPEMQQLYFSLTFLGKKKKVTKQSIFQYKAKRAGNGIIILGCSILQYSSCYHYCYPKQFLSRFFS